MNSVNQASLSAIDEYMNKEFCEDKKLFGSSIQKPRLTHSYSSANLRNNYVVNTDTDVLFDYINKTQLHVKRNGEFLSLSDNSNNKVIINLYDLFEQETKKRKSKTSFFKNIFSKN